MALRLIVKEGEEILNKKCRPVEKFDEKLFQLLDDMAQTMYAANGVGLAAPQIGVLRRVCVIDIGDGLIEMINPVITKTSGIQESAEGCLSSPGKCGITRRPKKVTVEFFDRNGNKQTMKGEDLLAKAFCHEIDHLDGILFANHVIYWE
jgi:peptide deformylase